MVRVRTFVDLDWTLEPGVTSYTISRATSADGTYTPIYTGPSSSFRDEGLVDGITYYYTISASNEAGVSPASDPALTSPSTSAVAQAPGYVLASGYPQGASIFSTYFGGFFQQTWWGFYPYRTDSLIFESTADIPGDQINSGPVMFKFVWNSPLVPTPKTAVVMIVAEATARVQPSGTVKVDDGFQDPPIANGPYDQKSMGTHWIVVKDPGQSFPVTINPSAQTTGGNYSYTLLHLEVSWSHVCLNVGGTINPDKSGVGECLVGQAQNPSFLFAPYPSMVTGVTFSNQQIKVDGITNVFSGVGWNTADQSKPWSHHTWTPFGPTSTVLYAGSPGTEKLSGTADLAMDDGTTSSASAETSVRVHSPEENPLYCALVVKRYGSTTVTSKLDLGVNISSGGPPDIYFPPGMTCSFSISALALPSEFRGLGSPKQSVVQQTTPGEVKTTSSSGAKVDGGTDSDIYFLDTEYPLPVDTIGPFTGMYTDTPDYTVTPDPKNPFDTFVYIEAKRQFRTFLVYTPPASPNSLPTFDIPVMYQEWNWIASAKYFNGDWHITGNIKVKTAEAGGFDLFHWLGYLTHE